MKFSVDAWDPGSGTSFQETAETLEASSARVSLDVEHAAASWRPVEPTDVATPSAVLFVDGVRRIDARLWIGDESGGDLTSLYGTLVALPLLVTGNRPAVPAAVASSAIGSLPAHLTDPAAAWPAPYSELLPGPIAYWACTAVAAALLGGVLVGMFKLFGFLGIVLAIMIFVGCKPIKKVVDEKKAIESGEKASANA